MVAMVALQPATSLAILSTDRSVYSPNNIGFDMPMHHENRTILITGAALGIGRACARRVAAEGARVALLDIRPAVEALAQVLREGGATCEATVVDIADPVQTARAVERTVSTLGPIDCLVNNAGIVDNIAPLARMQFDAWQREIGVNLTGPFNMIRAVAGAMADRGWGRIVNMSSAAARGGLFNQVGYAATKSALFGLTYNVALEYGRKGITCNMILPGLIGTETVLSMPQPIIDSAVAATPSRRLGTPEEVAALVSFLCSEEAGFINGAEIDIDGGMRLNTVSLGSIKENRRP
jgi:NAD(P)-dependent dehydrogenase (short-subunit alcohol dehydrogenase family)